MRPVFQILFFALFALIGAAVYVWLSRGPAIMLDLSASGGAC